MEEIKHINCEFGISDNIRFLNPENVDLRDEEENIIYCTCGNKVESAIIGKHAYIFLCSNCIKKIS